MKAKILSSPAQRIISAFFVFLSLLGHMHAGILDFSLTPDSPEVPGEWSSADILFPPGNAIRFTSADLGLSPTDIVNAVSYGTDEITPVNTVYFYTRLAYSVKTPAAGMGGPIETQAGLNGAAGDTFGLDFVGVGNRRRVVRSPFLMVDAEARDLTPLPNESDINGLALPSIRPGFTVFLTFPPGSGRNPADIYVVRGKGEAPEVFATAAELGLSSEDVIDGLALGSVPFTGDPPQDLNRNMVIWVSLAEGSPTRALVESQGGDRVIQVWPRPVKTVLNAKQLQVASSDEINALAVLDPSKPEDQIGVNIGKTVPRLGEVSALSNVGALVRLVFWEVQHVITASWADGIELATDEDASEIKTEITVSSEEDRLLESKVLWKTPDEWQAIAAWLFLADDDLPETLKLKNQPPGESITALDIAIDIVPESLGPKSMMSSKGDISSNQSTSQSNTFYGALGASSSIQTANFYGATLATGAEYFIFLNAARVDPTALSVVQNEPDSLLLAIGAELIGQTFGGTDVPLDPGAGGPQFPLTSEERIASLNFYRISGLDNSDPQAQWLKTHFPGGDIASAQHNLKKIQFFPNQILFMAGDSEGVEEITLGGTTYPNADPEAAETWAAFFKYDDDLNLTLIGGLSTAGRLGAADVTTNANGDYHLALAFDGPQEVQLHSLTQEGKGPGIALDTKGSRNHLLFATIHPEAASPEETVTVLALEGAQGLLAFDGPPSIEVLKWNGPDELIVGLRAYFPFFFSFPGPALVRYKGDGPEAVVAKLKLDADGSVTLADVLESHSPGIGLFLTDLAVNSESGELAVSGFAKGTTTAEPFTVGNSLFKTSLGLQTQIPWMVTVSIDDFSSVIQQMTGETDALLSISAVEPLDEGFLVGGWGEGTLLPSDITIDSSFNRQLFFLRTGPSEGGESAPLVILAVRLETNDEGERLLRTSFTGTPGRTYIIQATDVIPAISGWETLQTITANQASGEVEVAVPIAEDQDMHFFRVSTE